MLESAAMNRRTFTTRIGSYLLMAVAAGSTSLVGCGVFESISSWIPVGLAAINSIVTLLGPLIPPQAIAILTLVKAGFADLAAAVNQYNADTNPADKATLLAKIRTFLGAIASNFESFLNVLNLGTNPIIIVVISLAKIILGAIAGFLGQLPSANVVMMSSTFRMGQQTIEIEPVVYKKVGDFRKAFNSACAENKHPEIELK